MATFACSMFARLSTCAASLLNILRIFSQNEKPENRGLIACRPIMESDKIPFPNRRLNSEEFIEKCHENVCRSRHNQLFLPTRLELWGEIIHDGGKRRKNSALISSKFKIRRLQRHATGKCDWFALINRSLLFSTKLIFVILLLFDASCVTKFLVNEVFVSIFFSCYQIHVERSLGVHDNRKSFIGSIT